MEQIQRKDALRLAQLQASGDPEFNVHHSYNHLSTYDVGSNPITPESDHFSYNNLNHYDEGHTPITPEQTSASRDPTN